MSLNTTQHDNKTTHMPKQVKATRPPWMPKRVAHEGRLKPNQDIYNPSHYRKAVRNHKMRNPYCVVCMEKGIITPVEVTDHILPINMGGAVMDEDNWQSMCNRCHNIKSGTEAHSKDSRGGSNT